MEKKVAFVLLALIALGFYATTFLFLAGNPFATDSAQASAVANFHVDNVTIAIPGQLIATIVKTIATTTTTTHANSSSTSCGPVCDPPPANVYSSSNAYAHMGNFSVTVKIQASETNIGHVLQEYLTASALSQLHLTGITVNNPTTNSYNLSLLQSVSASAFVAVLLLALLTAILFVKGRAMGSKLRNAFSAFRVRISNWHWNSWRRHHL